MKKLFVLLMTLVGVLASTVVVAAADDSAFVVFTRVVGRCLNALSVLAVIGMAVVLLVAYQRFRRRSRE